MADILYGCDMGSVATDLAGNVKDGQTFNVYSDSQGSNQFTAIRSVNSNFTVGTGTGGVVTSSSIGRVLFYAQDYDRTLWLKNGSNFWACNPVNQTDVTAARIASAVGDRTDVTDALGQRLTTAETNITNLQNQGAQSWQMWRGRMTAPKTTTSGNYVSLNMAGQITNPSKFAVNFTTDAVSVTLAGWYRVNLRAGWAFNPTGYRTVMVCLNLGFNSLDSASAPSSITTQDTRTGVTGAVTCAAAYEDMYLTPSDSLLFVVNQNSGGNLDVNNGRHLTSASLGYLGAA